MISIDVNNLDNAFDKHKLISENINNMNLDIEFIYCADFKNTKILRDFIEVIWKEVWLIEKDLTRFILVIDELNNNAIEYWSNPWWKNILRVKIVNSWDWLDFNIEVEDNWKWEKSKTALEMETLRAHQLKLWYWIHNSIRWRWLFMIIVHSVDRLYFKDSHLWWLIVWVNKKMEI